MLRLVFFAGENMRDIKELNAARADLCKNATELVAVLAETLRHNTAGEGVSEAVKNIEPLLTKFAALNDEMQKAAEESGKKNIRELIEAQPASAEREEMLRLFDETDELQRELMRRSKNVGTLLKRSKMFIDYHINVLSSAKAGNTYGPPGAAEGVTHGRKMFEADV